MTLWDLLTKPPAELAKEKIKAFQTGIWNGFWQRFNDLALIGFMACLFLWML